MFFLRIRDKRSLVSKTRDHVPFTIKDTDDYRMTLSSLQWLLKVRRGDIEIVKAKNIFKIFHSLNACTIHLKNLTILTTTVSILEKKIHNFNVGFLISKRYVKDRLKYLRNTEICIKIFWCKIMHIVTCI